MKTFKDLIPGNIVYVNGLESKVSRIELFITGAKFTVEVPTESKRCRHKLIELIEFKMTLQEYETDIFINGNKCLSTTIIKNFWELISLNKKIEEILEIQADLTKLQYKLNNICM